MKYRVRFELQDTLSEAQLAGLVERAHAVLGTLGPGPGKSKLHELTFLIEAHNPGEAIAQATAAFDEAIGPLPTGRVKPPYRVVVEDPNGPPGWPLVSTAGVRQLAQRPDFPKPLDIPGLAGSVYVRSAIEAWARTWDREARGGRPRKADD